MSRGALARATAPVLLLSLLGTAAAAGAREESPRLAVSGPKWAIAGSDVAVTVTAGGALAASPLPLALTVAVDGSAVERVVATGVRTRVVLDWESLPAGRHEILVKTGRERASYEIQVLPRRPVWFAVGLLGLAIGASIGLWRRARRARDAGSSG